MNFELTILGSGSALPTSRRYSTAQVLNVLERFFLIDCGEGTQLQIRNARLRISKINNIFISHVHGDHIFGLFGLLSTFNLLGRKTPLSIYGPLELKNIIAFYEKTFAVESQYEIVVHSVKNKSFECIFEDKIVEVYSIPLKHRIPSTGFLFREKAKEPNVIREMIEKHDLGIKDILNIKKGFDFKAPSGELIPNSRLVLEPSKPRSYAYCSDTAYYERIANYIGGVDLLYHEATFVDADRKIAKQTSHSTASQAAKIALKAGVKKLILGHFSNRYKNLDQMLIEARSVFSETYLANDLEIFKIDSLGNKT